MAKSGKLELGANIDVFDQQSNRMRTKKCNNFYYFSQKNAKFPIPAM